MYFWFLVFAGINGLLVTLLAMHVSYRRITLKIANGDGGHVDMKKAIRAHGNALEHTVLFGILVLAWVVSGAGPVIQMVLVSGFTLSRVLHAIGMLFAVFNLRRLGAAFTYIFELAACIGVLFFAFV